MFGFDPSTILKVKIEHRDYSELLKAIRKTFDTKPEIAKATINEVDSEEVAPILVWPSLSDSFTLVYD